MVAHLLRYISESFVEMDVFKCFPLEAGQMIYTLNFRDSVTHQHWIEWFGDPSNGRAVVAHCECCNKRDTFVGVFLGSCHIHYEEVGNMRHTCLKCSLTALGKLHVLSLKSQTP